MFYDSKIAKNYLWRDKNHLPVDSWFSPLLHKWIDWSTSQLFSLCSFVWQVLCLFIFVWNMNRFIYMFAIGVRTCISSVQHLSIWPQFLGHCTAEDSKRPLTFWIHERSFKCLWIGLTLTLHSTEISMLIGGMNKRQSLHFWIWVAVVFMSFTVHSKLV